jgi:glycosyltransferase involved in cell wall biosynthesis
MKVLHVIPSVSSVHGGPTRALALMEHALIENGITIETATTDDDGPHRRRDWSADEGKPESGPLRRYFPKRTEFYKVSPAFAKWISANVERYDLIHIHALFSFTSTAAAWAARRAAVPYVVRPLGTLNEYGVDRRRPWLKRMSMQCVEGPILRHAAAVHFTSDAEEAEASRLGIAMKAVMIPLGVEAAEISSAPADPLAFDIPESAPCVLFLSRLDAKKNIEGLLGAISLLKEELPALHLLIAGGGAPDYVASLKATAESLSISDRVIWAGHLEGHRKQAAFARAAVFALPSFSENFGIAAAEALAAGLPCVLGQGVAIAQEVVNAEAGVVVGTDPKSIAGGLRRIIPATETRRQMSMNAKRLAQQNFSVQAMGMRLQKLYTDILNR